jgi:hypothetical protein
VYLDGKLQERNRLRDQQEAYLKPLIKAIPEDTQRIIIGLSGSQIVDQISRGLLLSADVVTVFSWRALQV